MAKPQYRPGQKAPKSGQYPLVGPQGGKQGVEVTVVKGEPLPPPRARRWAMGAPT